MNTIREVKFVFWLQLNCKAYEIINLFSVYLNISSQFVFLVLLWVLNIGIPTHTSETKEVKMTAPVWLRERVYLNWNHPPPTQRRFTLVDCQETLVSSETQYLFWGKGEQTSNINDSALKRLKWCGWCRRLTSFSGRKMSGLFWREKVAQRERGRGVKQCHWRTAVSLGVFPGGSYNIHSRVIVHKSSDIIVPLKPMK